MVIANSRGRLSGGFFAPYGYEFRPHPAWRVSHLRLHGTRTNVARRNLAPIASSSTTQKSNPKCRGSTGKALLLAVGNVDVRGHHRVRVPIRKSRAKADTTAVTPAMVDLGRAMLSRQGDIARRVMEKKSSERGQIAPTLMQHAWRYPKRTVTSPPSTMSRRTACHPTPDGITPGRDLQGGSTGRRVLRVVSQAGAKRNP